MKEKNLKTIFFATIIIILLFSIYYIIKNKNKPTNNTEQNKAQRQINNNIKIGITKIDTLNPINTTSQDMQYISKLIYEPLINITEDFKLEEGLAIEWSKLDNTTYLIRLKENINWQNGKIFAAQDVLYTINYIKQNENLYSSNVKNIKNLEIINDYTIKIYLYEPEEDFEYMLCFPIICEKENIGTGNYYISNITDTEIKLSKKNDKKEITVKAYEDIANLYTAFSKEEVNVIITNNINYSKYIGTIGYNKKIICGREFDYLKINTTNKILSKEVVQSILYAINKNQIIYNIYNNMYIPAEFPLQYGSYLYKNNIESEYNPNKAKQILKDAGWEYNKYWTKDKQILKLEITTNYDRIDACNIIKENLETIGILVTIKQISNSYYENNLQNLNYNILLTGSVVSIKPEIQEYLDFKVEQLENIEETYKKIYTKYNEKPNFIGLYFNPIIILYAKNVQGNFNGNWYNIFYHIDTWGEIL